MINWYDSCDTRRVQKNIAGWRPFNGRWWPMTIQWSQMTNDHSMVGNDQWPFNGRRNAYWLLQSTPSLLPSLPIVNDGKNKELRLAGIEPGKITAILNCYRVTMTRVGPGDTRQNCARVVTRQAVWHARVWLWIWHGYFCQWCHILFSLKIIWLKLNSTFFYTMYDRVTEDKNM